MPFPNGSFDAEISDISFASVTTDGVVTYNARLEVDNDELLLRPGMTATVAVVTKRAEGVLTVPSVAFRYRPAVARDSGFNLLSMFTGRSGGRRGGDRPPPGPLTGRRFAYALRAEGRPAAGGQRQDRLRPTVK